MTPEEKAKKLLESFENAKSCKMSDYSKIYTPTARVCALICVNEIELYRKQIENEYDEDLYHAYGKEEYWNKVKQEINKL
jgi:hypothetical protein